MSFFPSDWDDEEEDDFSGMQKNDPEELAKEFESNFRDDFSANELIVLFKFYIGSGAKKKPQDTYKSVKSVLKLGIEQFPYLSVFYVHLTEILLREKDYRMARKYIQQAKENNHCDYQILFLEATIAGLEKNVNKAKELILQGLQDIADDKDAALDAIELLINYELFDLLYFLFVEITPIEFELAWLFERVLLTSEDPQIAEKLVPILELLVDQDPFNADLWYLLGLSFNQMDEHEKGAWAFDYAVTIDENFSEAWLGYMESIYELNKHEEFLEKYTELEGLFGSDVLEEIKGLKAWALYESGNAEEARKLYREILKIHPMDAESWYSLGLTYHHEGEYQKAIPLLEKAWEINAFEPDYGLILAISLVGVSKFERAIEVYETLNTHFPEHEEIYLDWNLLLYETGDMDSAIDVLEKGLKILPQSSSLMYRLGAIALLTGQNQVGEFLIESALLINAENHEEIFTFAPELKKSMLALTLISKHIKPKLNE